MSQMNLDLTWYELGGFISAGIAIALYSTVAVIIVLVSVGVLK